MAPSTQNKKIETPEIKHSDKTVDSKIAKKHKTAVKISLLDSSNEHRVYNLGKKFTHADVERMKKSHELEWQKVNSIVVPREVLPMVYISFASPERFKRMAP